MTSPDYAVAPRQLAVAAIIVVLIGCIPLFLVDYLPLVDLPAHIARYDILVRLPESEFLQERYTFNSYLLPNLGSDLMVVGLAQLMPMSIAVTLFLTLIMAVTVGGVVFLNYCIFGKVTLWPLVSSLLLFNFIFRWGFVNYLFGVGLMLWAVGAWMQIAQRPGWMRLTVGAMLALALYFAHLSAFGIYALVVGGWELQRAFADWRDERFAVIGRLAVAALPMMVPIALLLLVSPTGEAAGVIGYRSFLAKLTDFLRPLIIASPAVDIAMILVVALIAGMIVLRGTARLARSMVLPIGLVFVSVFAMPSDMMSASFADVRIPVPLSYLVIAATSVSLQPARLRAVALGLVVAMLAFRSVVLTLEWRQFDQRMQGFLDLAGRLPEGSTLFVASEGSNEQLLPWFDRRYSTFREPTGPMAAHASYVHRLFVPVIYADPRQQPISLQPRFHAISRIQRFYPIELSSAGELTETIDRLRAEHRAALGPSVRAYLLLLYPEHFLATAREVATVIGGDVEPARRWLRYVLLDITDPPPDDFSVLARP